jgi:hypothetical protein
MKTIAFAFTTIFAPRLSKIMLFNCMIFCIDLLLFYTTNTMNFTSLCVGFIYCLFIQLQYQWSYWTGSKASVNVCFVNSLCVC